MPRETISEQLANAVAALRKAELDLLLFPWDEVRRLEVERRRQLVEKLQAALKAAGEEQPKT